MMMGCELQHTSELVVCGISSTGSTLFHPFCSGWSGRFHCSFFKVQGCSWPFLLLMSKQREHQCVTDIRDIWDTCSSVPLVPELAASQEEGNKYGN